MVRGSILGMCHVFNLKSFQIISTAEYLLFVFFFVAICVLEEQC